MRLTLQTSYSLRLLIYLAVRGDGLATVADVAESYGISRHHLTKVAHRLGLDGYIETTRGRKGGLRLARAAAAMNLGEVVRRIEPDFAVMPCMEPVDAPCPLRPHCALRAAMDRARDAFLAVLDSYTLDQLASPGAEMRALLGIR
jgi:Rrf2 family nitric oxide-sensitive transcriptional repressor